MLTGKFLSVCCGCTLDAWFCPVDSGYTDGARPTHVWLGCCLAAMLLLLSRPPVPFAFAVNPVNETYCSVVSTSTAVVPDLTTCTPLLTPCRNLCCIGFEQRTRRRHRVTGLPVRCVTPMRAPHNVSLLRLSNRLIPHLFFPQAEELVSSGT